MDLAKQSYQYWKDKDKRAGNRKKVREIIEFNRRVRMIKENAKLFNNENNTATNRHVRKAVE